MRPLILPILLATAVFIAPPPVDAVSTAQQRFRGRVPQRVSITAPTVEPTADLPPDDAQVQVPQQV